MKVKEIYNLGIEMGINADFRGKEKIEELLKRRKHKFDKLSDVEKTDFDKDRLTNPFSDSIILNITEDKEIKKI